ncbi:MAG: Swt1 family HEPN domain-containing protein [Gemmatimonadetes bacterium]|nr:Swt1 family HEPN domain-containing protein [Gemmatimonadota bacterium]
MISSDPADRLALQLRMKKLFTEGFTVVDIAEPLLSFDADSEATEAASALAQSRDPVGGVRRDGRVVKYVRTNDLTGGTCADYAREIDPDQVVPHSAPLAEVVERLEDTEHCFVSMLGQIDAFVIREHFEKPPVRMWLFGMITIVETFLTETIAALYPDDAWIELVSTGRMRKARELHAERRRREQPARLIDCLQLGDKAQILLQDPEWREDFEVTSRRDGDRAIKEFGSLRNNLAHAQPIVPDNWEMIVTASSRLDRIVSRIGQGPVPRAP